MNSTSLNRFPRFVRSTLPLLVALFSFVFGARAATPIPSAEKLLPDDTLILVTIPDCTKMGEISRKSSYSGLWNDASMKPFKEKFMTRWKEEMVQPLERELNVSFNSYTGLLQGQLTFALIQNGWQGKDDQLLGVVLLLDTKDKSGQLKTNLADLRKKWLDAGKVIKTEKIRELDFSVLPMSTNDVPQTLRKFFPQTSEVQELGTETETKKASPKSELVIGQVNSLLIIGNSTKVVEKVVIPLTGGAIPSLGESAGYQANHQALFRDSPFYGWVNIKSFIYILSRKPAEKKDSAAPDPFAMFNPEKIISASGLSGLRTFAFNFRDSNDGSLFQFFLGVPEASRQGLFKILAAEARDSAPPAFVPADAVKFQRWRIDGQKAWATLEKVMADISPQALGYLNYFLDAANAAAKDKDPGFDVKKNLIGNLGDDMISYEKAARGSSPVQLKSPPSLFLLGSPHPEQLAAALKNVLLLMNQQSAPPPEREFLGRKIFSIPLPNLPIPMAESKPGAPRTLSYAVGGSYVAMAIEPAILEEYLRSSESQAKTLREAPGFAEAAQKVGGTATGLFGYENQAETMRATFEMLRKDPGSSTNSSGGGFLPGALGMSGAETNLKEWMDFSLLPTYDKAAKYFHFVVYAGSTTVDGLTLKVFSPTPPGLKANSTR